MLYQTVAFADYVGRDETCVDVCDQLIPARKPQQDVNLNLCTFNKVVFLVCQHQRRRKMEWLPIASVVGAKIGFPAKQPFIKRGSKARVIKQVWTRSKVRLWP